VSFFWQGLTQAWSMIVHGGGDLGALTWTTLKVAFLPTAVAAALGIPAGVALGIGRFRGRGAALAIANAGLGLPPVVVGLVISLLMFPAAPLGRFHLLFTLRGVYVAQTVLVLPTIIALTAAAVRGVAPGLLDQARAFGASRTQIGMLAVREARVGVLAALIAAIGSGLSEVGAVVLVGGNIEGLDQTLATAALQRVDAGHFADGVAIGIILLGLIVVVAAALTLLQRGDEPVRVRAS
jgi:tungstate transport system permease protein